jgi:quercetin dioxygenase-like cupin family protein
VAGRALFASMLSAEDASRVDWSRLTLDRGEVRSRHVHDADMAVCVTRGCLVLSLGVGFSEQLEVRAGDYALVPGGMVHQEAALDDGVEMVVAHVAPLGTAPAP